jgi:hypothetical protein
MDIVKFGENSKHHTNQSIGWYGHTQHLRGGVRELQEIYIKMIHENILYGYDYDDIENKLTAREDIKNYGFFSTFTLLLTSIMTVYRKFGKTPDIIDCKKGMAKFKNEENFDLYHHFFHINNDIEINFDEELPVPLSPDDHHTVYSEKYIKFYNPFFQKYFNINKPIVDRIDYLLNRYSLDDDRVSIIYRDSDKWTDFGGFNYVSAGAYMKKFREIAEKEKPKKILIQSENNGVVKTFGEAFGAIFFEETSLKDSSDNYPPIPKQKHDIINWCEFYIASLWIHAKSKYVITYTGNSSFFVYLVRQTTKNFIQEITFTKNYNDFFINEN